MTFAIEIKRATVAVGARSIMAVRDLKIQSGDRLAVVGKSGSGKSTFIRMLGGLVSFEGSPVVVEAAVNEARRTIAFIGRLDASQMRTNGIQLAYVPQQLGLWANMSVGENITLPTRRLLGYSEPEARGECERILGKLGLLSKMDQKPNQLSGGEQQRIAIARAAVCQPDLVLLDEITSALDPTTTAEILGLLPEMFDERSAVVFVTHQLGFARKFADHILFFESGACAGKLSVGEASDQSPSEGLGKLVSDSKTFYSW